MKTWTETSEAMASRVLLTRRAGVEVTVQVERDARPVGEQARRFGVAGDTIHDAVTEYGQPLVDDPERVGRVQHLGVDETSFTAARPGQATQYATGMIDLDRRAVIDMIEGRSGADLRRWLQHQSSEWLKAVKVVATDLTDAYRSGMVGLLDHARKVADPFHVVRVAQRCLDATRRRVQNQTLGHRGRKDDPSGPGSTTTSKRSRPRSDASEVNLCIKKVKRAGHRYRCFTHYRLRVLLHTGGGGGGRRDGLIRPPGGRGDECVLHDLLGDVTATGEQVRQTDEPAVSDA